MIGNYMINRLHLILAKLLGRNNGPLRYLAIFSSMQDQKDPFAQNKLLVTAQRSS